MSRALGLAARALLLGPAVLPPARAAAYVAAFRPPDRLPPVEAIRPCRP